MLACLAGCALLLAIITPTLATSGSRADRVACFNNLRQIGNALRHYALEHNDLPPWLPWSPAGNFNQPGKHELWFQYWWIRDYIESPKFLMDPGETRSGARVATNWDLNPNGGLQLIKNNAVAYPLGLDSATFIPQTIMVADRHMEHAGFGGCSSGISTAARISTRTARWSGEVHGVFGNVALADGSVESVDSDGLRRILSEVRENFYEVHIMMADWQ